MTVRLPCFLPPLALAALALLCLPFAAAGQDASSAPHFVLLRASVDATGKVQSARSLDPETVPALVTAGVEIARKLQFEPARKNGRAVPSETALMLTLALVPKAGGFGISLRRANNGPNVLSVGKVQPPKVDDNGGVVVVAADLRPDGSVDMASFKVESAQLRVASSFAEERFIEAARNSLKDSRFQLEKVDGIETPARISVPYQFNNGLEGDQPRPTLKSVSKIEGVVLPRIDYAAPGQ